VILDECRAPTQSNNVIGSPAAFDCSKGCGACEAVSIISIATHAGDQFGKNWTLELRNSARFHNFNVHTHSDQAMDGPGRAETCRD
jgi:hypothetical protein